MKMRISGDKLIYRLGDIIITEIGFWWFLGTTVGSYVLVFALWLVGTIDLEYYSLPFVVSFGITLIFWLIHKLFMVHRLPGRVVLNYIHLNLDDDDLRPLLKEKVDHRLISLATDIVADQENNGPMNQNPIHKDRFRELFDAAKATGILPAHEKYDKYFPDA